MCCDGRQSDSEEVIKHFLVCLSIKNRKHSPVRHNLEYVIAGEGSGDDAFGKHTNSRQFALSLVRLGQADSLRRQGGGKGDSRREIDRQT